jgi:branched-chain amino acid transport system substrate-binding protein
MKRNVRLLAVVACALYNEGGVILAQARKMGVKVPFVGGNGFNSPKVIEIAQDAAEGLIVATPWFGEKNDPKVRAFVAKYEKAHGKKPDQFAAQAYDAFHIMANALAATKNFQGVLGEFSFDAERDVVMAPNVLIVKGGKFTIFN